MQRELSLPSKRVAACKSTWSNLVSVIWQMLLFLRGPVLLIQPVVMVYKIIVCEIRLE